jgi:hypothetical protein
MESIETKSVLEEIVLSKLDERGWTIHGSERSGLDLDIDVSFEEDRGTIRMRGAISVPRELEASAQSAPTLVRVDLGDPQGEPEWWSLWDHYLITSSFPPYKSIISRIKRK